MALQTDNHVSTKLQLPFKLIKRKKNLNPQRFSRLPQGEQDDDPNSVLQEQS